MILFCSQHVSKQMEKGQLTKPDYAYQRGRQFIRYEFALSTIANENNHEYNLIDALDLSSKRIDANITLAMQSRSRQSRTLDAMNLTWVVDSGCTHCALPKQLFKHINASRTTLFTSNNGASNAPIYNCERMPRLQDGDAVPETREIIGID